VRSAAITIMSTATVSITEVARIRATASHLRRTQ